MTKITHVKIIHYIDYTKKTQIKSAMLAALSPAFHAISTKHV